MIDPINDIENDMDDDTSFPCACGDPACVGDNGDAANIRIGKAWYAADCVMANAHPIVVESREWEQRRSEQVGK